MYYGNPAATAQNNTNGVWASHFKGVWHFAGNLFDSTSNDNHGTNGGATESDACPIYKCMSFDGINDRITINNNTEFNFEFATEPQTLWATSWLNDNNVDTITMIMGKTNLTGVVAGWQLAYLETSNHTQWEVTNNANQPDTQETVFNQVRDQFQWQFWSYGGDGIVGRLDMSPLINGTVDDMNRNGVIGGIFNNTNDLIRNDSYRSVRDKFNDMFSVL